MATKYFFNNDIFQDNFLNLDNWWDDASHTVPASSLPSEADDIVVETPSTLPIEGSPYIYNSILARPANSDTYSALNLGEGVIIKSNIVGSGFILVGLNSSESAEYPCVVSGNISGLNISELRYVRVYGNVNISNNYAGAQGRFSVFGNLKIAAIPSEQDVINGQLESYYTCDVIGGAAEMYGGVRVTREQENGSYINPTGIALTLHDDSYIEGSLISGDVNFYDRSRVNSTDAVYGNLNVFVEKPLFLLNANDGYSVNYLNFDGQWVFSGEDYFRSNYNPALANVNFSGGVSPTWTFLEDSAYEGYIPSGKFYGYSYFYGSIGTGYFYDESSCGGDFVLAHAYDYSYIQNVNQGGDIYVHGQCSVSTSTFNNMYILGEGAQIAGDVDVINVTSLPFNFTNGNWRNETTLQNYPTLIASGISDGGGGGGGGINGSSILGMI